MTRLGAITAFTLLSLSLPAEADYLRTGPIKGTVCTGIVIKSCSKVSIDAVESDGQPYTIADSFKHVDEHSGSICHINLKSNNVITNAIHKAKNPTLLTKTADGFKKVSPDYITFKCRKQ